MKKAELKDGVGKHLGERYKAAMTRMKPYPDWDANAHIMKPEFLIDFLESPTEEKLTQIKDTIQFGLSKDLNSKRNTDEESKITGRIDKISQVKTTSDLVSFMRVFD